MIRKNIVLGTMLLIIPVIFFSYTVFAVESASPTPKTIDNTAEQLAAIATAKLFTPSAGISCAAVITPAVHTATKALFTFPSACLAPGWVVATSVTPTPTPTAPSTTTDKKAALAAARAFLPPDGTVCGAVRTPAVHTTSRAKYTFPSSCLPTGWVVVIFDSLKIGDTGIKVTALQIKLIRVGFSAVTSSSTFDSATETALKTFQTNNALEVNGILDYATNNILNKAAANSRNIVAKLNDNNDTVKTINANLKLVGFTPDDASLFGTNTQKATMVFQARYKIAVTGMMDRKTNSKLKYQVKVITKEIDDLTKGIKVDSKKALILKYQNYLIKLGYTITADGVYGETTVSAVKDFQGKNKNIITDLPLNVNGVINNETKKVIIFQVKALDAQKKIDLAILREDISSDTDLLKIIIEWEAKNPGYKLAVTPTGDIVVVK